MDTNGVADVVDVRCDRCDRPGWQFTEGLGGLVALDGARLGPDTAHLATLAGSRPGSYRLNTATRPGAFILSAWGTPGAYGDREKLVCIGRKHPRYERVVTRDRFTRAYRAAVAAGRTSIRMRDI